MKPTLSRFSSLCLRLGSLTFGGGDPTIQAMRRDLVDANQWMTNERYALIYGLARITPGTNVLAFCAGAGYELLRWPGAIAAVIAVATPAAFLAVWATVSWDALSHNLWAAAAITGLMAAAAGLMAASTWKLTSAQWKEGRRLTVILVPAAAFALLVYARLGPVEILALAVAASWFWSDGE